MKISSSFLVLFLFMLIVVASGPLRAQTSDGTTGRLGFLSADERARVLKARQQALENNPDLKSEQESLEKERQYVKDQGTNASQNDRQTLLQNFMVHSKKMREAMLKVDSSLGPVLDQIDAKMKDRFKEHAGQTGTGNSTN